MNPSRWTAKRCEEPERLRQQPPTCCRFVRITVRKRSCRCAKAEKTNEIPVAKAVLPTLPIAGRVTTADALHTHAEFMQVIHDQRGRCVLTVKKNQPTLYAGLATYFADPHASCQRAQTWDRCM